MCHHKRTNFADIKAQVTEDIVNESLSGDFANLTKTLRYCSSDKDCPWCNNSFKPNGDLMIFTWIFEALIGQLTRIDEEKVVVIVGHIKNIHVAKTISDIFPGLEIIYLDSENIDSDAIPVENRESRHFTTFSGSLELLMQIVEDNFSNYLFLSFASFRDQDFIISNIRLKNASFISVRYLAIKDLTDNPLKLPFHRLTIPTFASLKSICLFGEVSHFSYERMGSYSFGNKDLISSKRMEKITGKEIETKMSYLNNLLRNTPNVLKAETDKIYYTKDCHETAYIDDCWDCMRFKLIFEKFSSKFVNTNTKINLSEAQREIYTVPISLELFASMYLSSLDSIHSEQ